MLVELWKEKERIIPTLVECCISLNLLVIKQTRLPKKPKTWFPPRVNTAAKFVENLSMSESGFRQFQKNDSVEFSAFKYKQTLYLLTFSL